MAPSWSVPARLSGIVVRGRTYSVRVPALLRGDEVRHLRYGSRISLSGRASESFSPEAQSLTLRVLGPVHVRSPPGPVARATTRIRDAFREACAGLPADAGALLLGLAVGDESTLPADLDAAMVRAGLAHLTAVSGSNTSLVVAIAMAAVAGLGLGWRVRVVTCLAVLSAYVMLVRPQPSVLRAAAMGVVALVALSAGGRRRGPPALLASALVLLLVLPQFALSLGFALSFAATAGLLVVGPPIAERLGRWPISSWMPEPLRAALAVAAAAHLATLPLAILMGNGASLVALPANVLVTPLVPFATVLGLAAALVAPVASGPRCRAGHRRVAGDGGDRVGGPDLLGPAVRGGRRARRTRRRPRRRGGAGARRSSCRPRMATLAGPADRAGGRRVARARAWCSTTAATRAGHRRTGWSSPATWARVTGC